MKFYKEIEKYLVYSETKLMAAFNIFVLFYLSKLTSAAINSNPCGCIILKNRGVITTFIVGSKIIKNLYDFILLISNEGLKENLKKLNFYILLFSFFVSLQTFSIQIKEPVYDCFDINAIRICFFILINLGELIACYSELNLINYLSIIAFIPIPFVLDIFIKQQKDYLGYYLFFTGLYCCILTFLIEILQKKTKKIKKLRISTIIGFAFIVFGIFVFKNEMLFIPDSFSKIRPGHDSYIAKKVFFESF